MASPGSAGYRQGSHLDQLDMAILALLGCRETMYSPAEAPLDDPSARYGAPLSRVVGRGGMVDYDQLEDEREALDDYVA